MNDAIVTCRDGKIRKFVASENEAFHFKGTKHTYVLHYEMEGRGIITMQWDDGTFILAPNKMQPVFVEAKTWARRWDWKALRDDLDCE